MNCLMRTLSLSTMLGFTACGSIPMREFEFDAIDCNETPRPCLVVLNIEFPKGSEFEVTMAPVLVVDGKVPRIPKSRKEARDYSGFVEEVRRWRITDPRKVLFILPKKSGSG